MPAKIGGAAGLDLEARDYAGPQELLKIAYGLRVARLAGQIDILVPVPRNSTSNEFSMAMIYSC